MTNRIADANNFLDVNGLNNIKLQSKGESKEDKQQALEAAAKQFESIFMQMLLKSMRKAEDVLSSDSPFNSETTKFYRDMHDQQLAVELSQNGSLGLAPLIVRQLGGDNENFTPHSVLRSDANLTDSKNTLLPTVNSVIDVNKTQSNFNEQQRNGQTTTQNFQTPIPLESMENKALSATENQVSAINQPEFSDPLDFIQAITEPAKQVEQSIGVPFQVVIAQAALETGWGKKIIKTASGESSNNLFNIKSNATWQGNSVSKDTVEYEQGTITKKNEPFRVYDSIKESVNDYIQFLTSSDRYQSALEHNGNVEHFLQGLQKAGYATDPNYANKILGTLTTVTNLLNK